MSVLAKHLQGIPVKNHEISVRNSESKLQKMAQVAVNFILEQSTENLKSLRETKSYWESFFSDWMADIEMKKAILEAIETGKRSPLNIHIGYICALAENGCAEPKDKSQPQKKKKPEEVSFLDKLRASGKPYFGFH
ncbi:MAG: hypothetical protein CMF61_00195 [Magnetococcales bacterium]|nr:hypothetical protein [Magnetococcales bacterium]